jgi:hypothetical protein
MSEDSERTRLEKEAPVFDERRIASLNDEEKRSEVRQILDKAREEGATSDELEKLNGQLQLHYKNPERYQRYTTLDDIRKVKSRPLPYRKE